MHSHLGGNVVDNAHGLQVSYEHQNSSSSSVPNTGVVIEWPARWSVTV